MATKDTITVDETINLLNELLKLDQKAVNSIFSTRFPCNQGIVEHPTAQVNYNDKLKVYSLGAAGIVNALFRTVSGGKRDGWGQIAFLRDQKTELIVIFCHTNDLDRIIEEGIPPL